MTKLRSAGSSPIPPANRLNYLGFGRGFFIQALIDLATIFAWMAVGVLLLFAVGSPVLIALYLVLFN